MTERQFQAQIEQLAALCGWALRYHTFNSKRSVPGFPDLTMVRGPELIFAEIKLDHGRLSAHQQEWLTALTHVADTIARGAGWQTDTNLIDVYVWKPSDWPDIERRLARGRRIEQAA